MVIVLVVWCSIQTIRLRIVDKLNRPRDQIEHFKVSTAFLPSLVSADQLTLADAQVERIKGTEEGKRALSNKVIFPGLQEKAVRFRWLIS